MTLAVTGQWIASAALALAVVVGATVAVCLGHVSEATYIAVVGPVVGVYVGAGVHAQGVVTGTEAPVKQPPSSGPVGL